MSGEPKRGVPDDNKPKKGEFFALTLDTRQPGPGHGVVFENLKQLLTPPKRSLRPWEGGIPPLKEMPRLVYDPKEGDFPRDLEGSFSEYWLISERLKNVFGSVDPDAFAFAKTDFRLQDGTPGPPYYLCDVVRVLDAVDEENSILKIATGEEYVLGKAYDFSGTVKLAFKKEIVGDAHVFRAPYSAAMFIFFMDKVAVTALTEAGIFDPADNNGICIMDASDFMDI